MNDYIGPDHNYWIQCSKGTVFDFTSEDPVAQTGVNLESMALSLSRTPRFRGHTNHFYSVADHSMHVTYIVRKMFEHEPSAGVRYSSRIELLALVHDLHEAFVGDVPTPLANYLRDFYRFDLNKLKRAVQADILHVLGIMPPTPPEEDFISLADSYALARERNLFMESNLKWWSDRLKIPSYLDRPIDPNLSMRDSYRVFMAALKSSLTVEKVRVASAS
jgi:5'-deoxynucleotidase YfbR-like HD superfamily hydrolase